MLATTRYKTFLCAHHANLFMFSFQEKKIFDSADYFMEQDKEKKRGDVDVEVEIDDKAEEHNSDENSPCKHERDRVSVRYTKFRKVC